MRAGYEVVSAHTRPLTELVTALAHPEGTRALATPCKRAGVVYAKRSTKWGQKSAASLRRFNLEGRWR